MRILLVVQVTAVLVGTMIGCEDPDRPPGAPECVGVAPDSGLLRIRRDGGPQSRIPCPVEGAGGMASPSPPPMVGGPPPGSPGASDAAGTGSPGGGGFPGTGAFGGIGGLLDTGGTFGFGGMPDLGGTGATDVGAEPGCCG